MVSWQDFVIRRNELVNRAVTPPFIVVVVLAPFTYEGRVRKAGERLELTRSEAASFGAEGYVAPLRS